MSPCSSQGLVTRYIRVGLRVVEEGPDVALEVRLGNLGPYDLTPGELQVQEGLLAAVHGPKFEDLARCVVTYLGDLPALFNIDDVGGDLDFSHVDRKL